MTVIIWFCEECGEIFSAMFHLRQHARRKHSNKPKFECENCGVITQNDIQLTRHKVDCINGYGFIEKQKTTCRYFANGHCWKGNQCRFAHKKKEESTIQACRNGQACSYLKNKVCKFYHRNTGYGFRSDHYEQKFIDKRCKFQDECFRLPNCPFIHEESDFPKLPKINKPPLWERIARWQEN